MTDLEVIPEKTLKEKIDEAKPGDFITVDSIKDVRKAIKKYRRDPEEVIKIPASPPTHTGEREWHNPSPGASHYKQMKIEPGHFCHLNKMNSYETYAIKYICRHNLSDLPKGKGGKEDIEKAIDCLKLILELDYSVT